MRRRFWEKVLRAVDAGGLAGQLRTQLKIVHEAVRSKAEAPLGTVIPGDYVYDQLAPDLLQTAVLLPELNANILKLRDGTPDGALKSRLCALIFLIGKLPREVGTDAGIRSTPDMLADLLVEDLKAGSNALRVQIPVLLLQLAAAGVVMQVDSEYRLQTRESSAWDLDYREKLARLLNDEARMASERNDILRKKCLEELKDNKIPHGQSKVSRKFEVHVTTDAPARTGQSIPVWVRDGWSEDFKAVLAEARAAGTDSPLIFAFLPKTAADEIKQAIASLRAAEETLQMRGTPGTPEGIEARSAIQTRATRAELILGNAVAAIFRGARVVQAGGTVVPGNTLLEMVRNAADTSLTRLFPQFGVGDDPRWERVVERVKKGDGNALEALDFKGESKDHPVCVAVLSYVGPGA